VLQTAKVKVAVDTSLRSGAIEAYRALQKAKGAQARPKAAQESLSQARRR